MILNLSRDWMVLITRLQAAEISPHELIGWAVDGIERDYEYARDLIDSEDDQLSEYGLENKAKAAANFTHLGTAYDVINALCWETAPAELVVELLTFVKEMDARNTPADE